MVNVWKISTLVLAGALVVMVGQGASVRETTACDANEPTKEEQTQIRMNAAMNMLDRAEAQVKLASAARPRPRAAALEQIALAKVNIERSLEPEARPVPLPRPPMKKVPASDKTASLAF